MLTSLPVSYMGCDQQCVILRHVRGTHAQVCSGHLSDELSCNFRYILFLQACKEHLHSAAGQFNHVLPMLACTKTARCAGNHSAADNMARPCAYD